MALSQGHQFGRILVQNIWKIIGAFGLGVIAVVGAGLVLSDVHRIPQATRSSANAVAAFGEKSGNAAKLARGGDQPNQISGESTNAASPASQQPDAANIRPSDRSEGRNTPARAVRRRHPANPTETKVLSENKTPSDASPLPIVPTIPTTSPGQAASQLASIQPNAGPVVLAVPAATPITIRLTQQVSSRENHKGEVFKGTLAAPLTANGIVVAPTGAPVIGRIVDARRARLFRGGSNLNLELVQLETPEGRSLALKTTQWYETGSHSKVVKAAILPSEAAKKVVSGVKSAGADDASTPERTVAPESTDAGEKSEKKSTVTLSPGTEIVFRLLEPLTISGNHDHH